PVHRHRLGNHRSPMNAEEETTRRLKERATELGFELCGVTPAVAGLGESRLRQWLAEGRHGEMGYMERHLDARLNPSRVLDSVQSIVVVGLNYRTSKETPPELGLGRISCYAQGADYHDVLRSKL